MALFVLSNANLAYGHVDLLANTAFSLEEGERVVFHCKFIKEVPTLLSS